MKRLFAIGAACAGLLFAAHAWAAEAVSATRPNVLVILADDLGYGDLSSFGAEDLETPNIDRLVSRGLKFTNFHANCPVCSPTRASLLTGRYPDLVGVPGVIRTHSANSWGYLRPYAVLLPALLKEAGYRTAMVGKWHLGLDEPNLPTSRGFEHFHGFLGDMMDDYYTHLRHGQNYMRLGSETIEPEGHATELFTAWAVEWLQKQDDRAPFSLYLAYNAPHSPIQPPEEWLAKYRQEHPDVPELRAKIAALIEHLDDGVGKVLAALEEAGHADQTLVIFTSDNGGSLPHGSKNGRLAGGKQDMLEGGLRVPACAAWPGRIKPGSRADELVMTMDLFPTITAAAGVKVEHAVDGISLADVFDATRAEERTGPVQASAERDLFWVRLEGGKRYHGAPYYAVRRGDWKLLQNDADEPMKLYNLAADPEEQTDEAPAHPEIVARLRRALDAHIDAARRVPWRDRLGKGPGEM